MKTATLVVTRKWLSKKCTVGQLTLNGILFCYTLEDVVRKSGEAKVHSATAIPAGTYPVILNISNRFKKLMPLVQNVPGFAGVRIHPGNTAADTQGCLLVGLSKMQTNDKIYNSQAAYEQLMAKLVEFDRITLTIQ
ncbi:DUF5675 family protein [Hymenobacter sp. BT175]|uniref:DUF5675 family protein n=1 Tax=Hymenobacter translucens TaxID=2886507 RepID=UPI001D0DD6AB|nr:DUF5675 family protein [Hymenobacter translucens]MCC2546431.1 DUF5675 family protein [Hymenobacter translucens]